VSELIPEAERERAHRAVELEERDPIFRRVALVITLATLLAAGTGYLERVAATHQASADRNARAKAIEAVSAAIQSDVAFQENRTLSGADDPLSDLADNLANAHGTYPHALSIAYYAAAQRLHDLRNAFFGTHYNLHGGFDSVSFFEDRELPRYEAAEWQQAYAAERGSWASKRGGLIFAISVFAVALFLLGLTLTVPQGSRQLFFWAGCAFAVGATGYVLYTWFQPTKTPSRPAIEAFARAEAANDANAPSAEVIDDASTAIEHRGDYEAAYVRRGTAHLSLAFDAASGPVTEVGATGTEEREAASARDDLQRAAHLDSGDYFAWVNLAIARFLLHDDRGALAANGRALAAEPTRPVVNLNRVFFDLVTGRPCITPGTSPPPAKGCTWFDELQDDAIPKLVQSPLSARDGALSGEEQLIGVTLHRPPNGMTSYLDDLNEFRRQLEVLQATFDTFPPSYGNLGQTEPSKSAAALEVTSADFSNDLSSLVVNFSYQHVQPTDRRVYFLFVNGQHVLTEGPFSWSDPRFPDINKGQPIAHSFQPDGGFHLGDRIRTEIFVQGNLRSACRFTVRKGSVGLGDCASKGGGSLASAPAAGGPPPASG
jgi:hypothetical protein